MQTFIRVIEVWTLDKSGEYLEFNDGIYGSLDQFREHSQKETFHYGEGLPGTAWKTASPTVLKSFDEANFLRTEIAHQVGLTSGIALPIFCGEQLKAVLVFLCGDAKQPSGAIEVWKDDGLSGMALVEGYYGELEKFEWLSKHIKFQRGRGLPGMVWDTAEPLIADMSDSSSFLRAKAAEDAGIKTGFAIPVNSNTDADEVGSVVTFLSSRSTPIARRFEIWKVNDADECLQFASGIDQDNRTIEAAAPDRHIKKGQGSIGNTWENGTPGVCTDLANEPSIGHIFGAAQKYNSLLTIPIFHQQVLQFVVVFYN